MDGFIHLRKWGGVSEAERTGVKTTSQEAAWHIGGIQRSQTNCQVTGEEDIG